MAISVRPAQVTDLENMLAVWLEAKPLIPLWAHRHTHYLEFPEDTRTYDRQWSTG